MGKNSGIAWTNHTFNAWIGCCPTSPACKNCYAARDPKWRLQPFGVEWTRDGHRHITSAGNWREPYKWDREAATSGIRAKVFAEDLGDLFEARADLDQLRSRLWKLISETPHLDWQLCTKRIENVRSMVPAEWWEKWPSNVWIGTTVEDKARAVERIPLLLKIPAKVRFVSVEPVLERIDLTAWLDRIHWVIVGGESRGRGQKPSDVRPFDADWARVLRDQCEKAGVAFFLKQWGANCPTQVSATVEVLGKQADLPVLDGAQWAQFPDSFQSSTQNVGSSAQGRVESASAATCPKCSHELTDRKGRPVEVRKGALVICRACRSAVVPVFVPKMEVQPATSSGHRSAKRSTGDVQPPRRSAVAGTGDQPVAPRAAASTSLRSEDPVVASDWPWPQLPPEPQATRQPFPLEALSQLHRDYVASVGAVHNVPADVPAMQSLSVVSTAAAKRAVVSIGNGDPQPLSTWSVVGLRTGEGKTPSHDEVTGVLQRAQQRMAVESAEDVRKTSVQRRVLARRRQYLEGVAARTADEDDRAARLQEAEDVAAQLHALEERHVPRLIVGDITPEALVVRLAEQGGRLALLSDEGSELFNGLQRRAVGGVQPVDQLLKAYSGSQVNVDRKTSGTVVIPDPALTIGVSVQPSVLHDLVRAHGGQARGFLERFLFSVPLPLDSRTEAPGGIDQEGKRDFTHTVAQLLALPAHDRHADHGQTPPVLVVETGPGSPMRQFAAELDERSRGNGDLSSIYEWISKQRGNTARLAALLHLYDNPHAQAPAARTVISPATVERAILINRYCIAHAQVAYGIGALVGDDESHAVVGWLRRHGTPVVRLRDMLRGLQTRFATVDSLRRVVAGMVEDGYLRPRVCQERRLGRPAAEYDVHPALLA